MKCGILQTATECVITAVERMVGKGQRTWDKLIERNTWRRKTKQFLWPVLVLLPVFKVQILLWISVFDGLLLPSSGYLAGYFLIWLFAWSWTLRCFSGSAVHLFPKGKLGEGRDWAYLFKKDSGMCQVLFHDLFGCESFIEEEPLHARLFTLRLWEGTLCTSSHNLFGKIPEDFSAAGSKMFLCQNCAWQVCRIAEHS